MAYSRRATPDISDTANGEGGRRAKQPRERKPRVTSTLKACKCVKCAMWCYGVQLRTESEPARVTIIPIPGPDYKCACRVFDARLVERRSSMCCALS
eukprot:748935-Prymnesium_polylepis.1